MKKMKGLLTVLLAAGMILNSVTAVFADYLTAAAEPEMTAAEDLMQAGEPLVFKASDVDTMILDLAADATLIMDQELTIAAIWAKNNKLTITGPNTLHINNYGNMDDQFCCIQAKNVVIDDATIIAMSDWGYAVRSSGDILMTNANVTATGKSGAIRADGSITVKDSIIDAKAPGYMVHAIYADDNINVTDSNITTNTCVTGLAAGDNIVIDGGEINANSTGSYHGSVKAYNGTVSIGGAVTLRALAEFGYGVVAGSGITITSGNIFAYGGTKGGGWYDGLYAESGDITISGGDVVAVSLCEEDGYGIHAAKGAVKIQGGTVEAGGFKGALSGNPITLGKELGFVKPSDGAISSDGTKVVSKTDPGKTVTDVIIKKKGSTPVPTRTYIELTGGNRYATAAALAEKAFPNAPKEIVIVKSTDFPDALSANAYAGAADAPVLLSSLKALSPEITALLTRTWGSKVTKATFIGKGFEAKVISDLKACGIKEFETLAGDNRYATAEAVMKAGFDKNYFTNDTVIIATGQKAADALSVSPWSYKQHYPMLLATSKLTLPDSSMALLKEKGFKKVILLGNVNDSCAAGLPTTRLMGATRYETSLLIADYFINTEKAGSYQNTGFAMGYNKNYPDALAAGMVLGRMGAPVMLVKNVTASDKESQSVFDFCRETLSDSSKYTSFCFIGAAAKGKENSAYDAIVKALES